MIERKGAVNIQDKGKKDTENIDSASVGQDGVDAGGVDPSGVDPSGEPAANGASSIEVAAEKDKVKLSEWGDRYLAGVRQQVV